MAKQQKIDPAEVVWHAPETVHNTLPDVAAEFEERYKGASAKEIVAAANQYTGEFRLFEGNHEADGRIVPKYGDDKLVWVNSSPSDNENTSGHYEVYDGPVEDYRPVRKAGEDG